MNKLFFVLLLFPIVLFGQDAITEAEIFIQKKAFSKAQDSLLVFVNKNPNNLKAIELLGDAFGHQEKWDNAIKYYKQLAQTKPDNANYHYKYGGALGMKALTINKFSALSIIGDVKSSFLKAAELDANHIDARWALVELYMQLPGIIGGSKSKSIKYANALENLSNIDGYLAKGYIYEYDNEPKLAEEFYKKAIKLLPSSSHKFKRNAMYYQIGKVCADYNLQLDKAENYLKIYLKNYSAKDGVPKAWAYYRLAQINKHKNNKKQALKWINKAISALPKIKVFAKEKVQIESLK